MLNWHFFGSNGAHISLSLSLFPPFSSIVFFINSSSLPLSRFDVTFSRDASCPRPQFRNALFFIFFGCRFDNSFTSGLVPSLSLTQASFSVVASPIFDLFSGQKEQKRKDEFLTLP